ncbi:hypothetical protein H5410_020798 [Solanum commersonii]|uniref:Uncharacterized protein n=1 Tax=Solanum commersonii TaxID=4109 RepID=A0A9J5ZAY2_SOLCO|nr:hypothetical protein H5410_020798 [Solanum commersonii]
MRDHLCVVELIYACRKGTPLNSGVHDESASRRSDVRDVTASRTCFCRRTTPKCESYAKNNIKQSEYRGVCEVVLESRCRVALHY